MMQKMQKQNDVTAKTMLLLPSVCSIITIKTYMFAVHQV